MIAGPRTAPISLRSLGVPRSFSTRGSRFSSGPCTPRTPASPQQDSAAGKVIPKRYYLPSIAKSAICHSPPPGGVPPGLPTPRASRPGTAACNLSPAACTPRYSSVSGSGNIQRTTIDDSIIPDYSDGNFNPWRPLPSRFLRLASGIQSVWWLPRGNPRPSPSNHSTCVAFAPPRAEVSSSPDEKTSRDHAQS